MTPKQQRFVEEYLKDLNGTQAAIRAGYSKRTANEQAARLLAKDSVQAAVTEALEARSERTKIDADWVLTRLASEATADLGDLYAEDGGLKPIADWPLIWRQGLVSGLDVDETFEDGQKRGQVTKVKLSDRIKRLELIGKHVDVQAFADRKELTGPGGGPIQVAELTPMKAALLILATLREAEEATDSRISRSGPVLAHSANSLEFNDTGAVSPRAGDQDLVE